jgi:hypothetical protein
MVEPIYDINSEQIHYVDHSFPEISSTLSQTKEPLQNLNAPIVV